MVRVLPPASDTAWPPEGRPGRQAGSGRRSSELGMRAPASAARRSGSGPRGSQQKFSGCILCRTGTG